MAKENLNKPQFNIHSEDGYTVLSNSIGRDKDLSLKARGLLTMMLMLPPEWNLTFKGLVSICKEGELAVHSALDELKTLGYVKVTKLNPDESSSGRYEYYYDVYQIAKK